MNKQDLINHGALLEGHFLLSSGLHSNTYIQCERLNETPEARKLVIESIRKCFLERGIEGLALFNVIIGGAYGAIKFADRVGDAIHQILENIPQPRSIYCERVPELKYEENFLVREIVKIKSGKFQLRRGFEIKKGEKVLIVEDVTTTGKSIGEVAELVYEYGGEIIGALSIIDRRSEYFRDKDNGALEVIREHGDSVSYIEPFISLIELDIPTYKPEDCPLCKNICISCLKDGKCEILNMSTILSCPEWQPKYTLVKPGSRG